MATPTTPYTELDHTTEGQSQPETSLNAALDGLDGSANGVSVWDYSAGGGGPGDADYDVTTGADRATVLASKLVKLNDTNTELGTGKDFIVPDVSHEWIVWNNTGQDVTFRNTSGTGVNVVTATVRHLFCDGSDIIVPV